ncbi:hypothetical protein, conserved [Eimeria praecox]|uniref:Uncharacterized protein n=1 Tax=Eimeria praecox TaxID=51316 RepID=U6HAP7_9EIME|nr:hypothetical protein, conserved [Eimeria praecox]
MAEGGSSSLKLFPSSGKDEADRQRSSSTVASASGGERLPTQDSLLHLPTPQLQQQAEEAVAAPVTAAETCLPKWKQPAAEQCNQGDPYGRPLETHAEATNSQHRCLTYSQHLRSSIIGGDSSSAAVGTPLVASPLACLPSVSRPQPVSVCLSSSNSSNSSLGVDSAPHSHIQMKQHAHLQQQPQQNQDQPVSCFVIEGFSGEVAYIEFIPQGDHTGLQLLARARRRGNSSDLVQVAAAAFDSPTAAADGSGEAIGIAATAARKPHAPTLAVQQLKPLLQQSPVLADARERGVGSDGASPRGSSSGRGPRCWVVGYEELIEGLLPAWRSLSALEDQQQLLAKTRFLRRSSSSSSSGPQEALQKIIQCYVGISRLAEETHAAADGLLQHIRNGKQLQQQLQQQQLHFAAALGRVDSFAHSLEQLQQLARQEEQQLQQLQQQEKQHIWKLMDQWSSGEIEMQQRLLKTVLQFAAADAKHLDELRDAWIQLICLCALPRELAAEETADAAQATSTADAAKPAASKFVDALSGDGSLTKRIGFTKEVAPRLLLLCLMLEADELARWVLHWIDACMPIATPPTETICLKEAGVPECKDSKRRSSWAPAAAAAAEFASGVAAAQEGMQPEAAAYTPEIYALLRRRLLRIRACGHLPRNSSKITKQRKSRSVTASPSHNVHQGRHRNSSPSTEGTPHLKTQHREQYVETAASAPAAPAVTHAPAALGSGEGQSRINPKSVAVSICPSPARRRSSTADLRAVECTSNRRKQQHQQHSRAPAAAVQSHAASTAYASDILGMIQPLLVSEEEAQLERQVREHDFLLLQRQQQRQQHGRQPQQLQQQQQQQQFVQQLTGVLTPSEVSAASSPQQRHQIHNTDQALKQQLLLLQQEEQLLQLHQQAQGQPQQRSFEQLAPSQITSESSFMPSPQERLPVVLENKPEAVVRQDLVFLHQQEQQRQQPALQLLTLPQPTAATTVAAEPRRSSRCQTPPPKRPLSMRRRQQRAGVFAAAPPKSSSDSSSSRSPSSRVSAIKEKKDLSSHYCRQQAVEPKTKASAAAGGKNVAARPAIVARRCNSPQQQQQHPVLEQQALAAKEQQRQRQEEQEHLQEQLLHLQEQLLHLQEKEQQQDSEPYTAVDLTLQRIFGVSATDQPEGKQSDAAAAAAAAAATVAAALQAAKGHHRGKSISGEERKALAEKLRRLAQQLHDDEEPQQKQQEPQKEWPQQQQPQQQQQEQNQRQQQQQRQEWQKRTPPNSSVHADSCAAASLHAICRSNSSSAINYECLVPSNEQRERQGKGSSSSSRGRSATPGPKLTKAAGPTTAANRAAQGCAASSQKPSQRIMQRRESRPCYGHGVATATEAAEATTDESESAAIRSVNPPTVEMEQQAKVLQVLDVLMRQIETSQGLTAANVPTDAAEMAATAVAAAAATRKVPSSFFSDDLPGETEKLQQKSGSYVAQRTPTTQPFTACAASEAAAASLSKVAARHAHHHSANDALRKGVRREGHQQGLAALGVSKASEDATAAAAEHEQQLFPTSTPSVAEGCSCCSGQRTPRQSEPSVISGVPAPAAASTASCEGERSAGTPRKRQHDPYSEAVLQLLHDEKQQQQQHKVVRKSHLTLAPKVQQQQPQQDEAFTASVTPSHRHSSKNKHHSLPQQPMHIAIPGPPEPQSAAEDPAPHGSGAASMTHKGTAAAQPEAGKAAEGAAAALAALEEAASAENITLVASPSQVQQQKLHEQKPVYGTTPQASIAGSSYSSSKPVAAVAAAVEAAPTPAKAVAVLAAEPDTAAGAPEAEVPAEAAEGKPVAPEEKPPSESKPSKQQQQPHGKGATAGKTAWATDSERCTQRTVIGSCKGRNNSNSNNSNSNSSSNTSKSAHSRTSIARRSGNQPDETETRSEQSMLQRRASQQQYSRQQYQQKKAATKSGAAAAEKPGKSASGTSPAQITTQITTEPQQQQRRERQLLLLQQQRQRLWQQQQLQQQQQLSPLEELKLRRIKVKEMALQQRLKASGMAKRLQQEEDAPAKSPAKEPSARPRPSIKASSVFPSHAATLQFST